MKSVFIIDDDQSVINGLVKHVPWPSLNLQVQDTACNGEEALQKVGMDPPDILITDIYMPKMDGLELIKKLHEGFPQVTIIVHSGYDRFDNARVAMKYGVKHFCLKPSTVPEIEGVIKEIIQELEIKEKEKKLIDRFNAEMKDYLLYSKDALMKELLMNRSTPSSIPSEKLELLQLSKDSNVVVSSLALIRPPYLTKSQEREWQLMKFSTGNIIKELVEEKESFLKVDLHLVDYSDSTFVIVYLAKQKDQDLSSISHKVTETILDTILVYLKLSLQVGMGRMKHGIQGIHHSYVESQKALEAAEHQEINKVFTYEEVKSEELTEPYKYPFEILKDIQTAIQQKDHEQLLELWDRIEKEIIIEKRTPLFIFQHICISVLNALMLDNFSNHLKEDSQMISDMVTKIYAQPSAKELSCLMSEHLNDWIQQMKEEITGKKSHRLIRGVKEYVHDYYDQEISLAEIANNLYVNRNYLSQLFKKVTGETFVTYLNKFRVEKAKEILREKQLMIYEVSEMVGYQNPTYFSQVFKSITGVSPSDFGHESVRVY